MPNLKKIAATLLLVLPLAIGAPAFAKKPRRHSRPNRSRLSRPAELVGTKAQRVAQNTLANNLGLPEIMTAEDLQKMVDNGALVELVDSGYYYIDPEPEKICKALGRGRYKIEYIERRVYVYPAGKEYLDKRFAPDHFVRFHTKWKITSGARSFEKQTMMSTKGSPCYNSYAAPTANPLERSLHLRGIVFDISRRVKTVKGKEVVMPRSEIVWMRERLVKDKKAGVIDAEEDAAENPAEPESQVDPIEERICYHIAVFPKKRPD